MRAWGWQRFEADLRARAASHAARYLREGCVDCGGTCVDGRQRCAVHLARNAESSRRWRARRAAA